MSPQRLWLLRVQWKANTIGPVEISKQALASKRQEGNDETKHPYPKKDGYSSSPARCQVLKGIYDADVFLQSEVGQEQDRYLGGQHGQGADDLTLTAVHPGLSVPVVLASEL